MYQSAEEFISYSPRVPVDRPTAGAAGRRPPLGAPERRRGLLAALEHRREAIYRV